MECVLKTGHFKLTIVPKTIVSITATCDELTSENASVSLNFEPAKEIEFKKERLQESYDEASSPVTMQHFSCMSETWNNDQIDDFVRKLGFLETQSLEVEQSVRFFQQLNQVTTKAHFAT